MIGQEPAVGEAHLRDCKVSPEGKNKARTSSEMSGYFHMYVKIQSFSP